VLAQFERILSHGFIENPVHSSLYGHARRDRNGLGFDDSGRGAGPG
jgi:hypothetical protein